MALLTVPLSGMPRTAGSDHAELWQVSLALLALPTSHPLPVCRTHLVHRCL